MYTWKINKILEENNRNIDSRTYANICETSPQISEVKYNAFANNFEIRTNDSPDTMVFTVYPANA